MFWSTFAGSFTTPEYSNKPYNSYEWYWSNHMFYTQWSEVITFVKVPITTTTITNSNALVCSINDVSSDRAIDLAIDELKQLKNVNYCDDYQRRVERINRIMYSIEQATYTTQRHSSVSNSDVKVIEFAIVVPIKEITNTIYVDRIVERVKWMRFPNALPNTGGFISNE